MLIYYMLSIMRKTIISNYNDIMFFNIKSVAFVKPLNLKRGMHNIV